MPQLSVNQIVFGEPFIRKAREKRYLIIGQTEAAGIWLWLSLREAEMSMASLPREKRMMLNGEPISSTEGTKH